MKLKIFTDKKYLPPHCDHVEMLYPFWGESRRHSAYYKIHDDPRSPDRGRTDRYMQIGRDIFTMVPLDQADLVIFPCHWDVGRQSDELAQLTIDSSRVGKPVVIFFYHDSEQEEISVNNSLVFRHSLRRSMRKSNEFALPAWSGDLLERHFGATFIMRKKQPKPVIGYCGYTVLCRDIRKRVWRVVGRFPSIARLTQDHINSWSIPKNEFIRTLAINTLEKSRGVETNFLIRTEFWNGAFEKFMSGDESSFDLMWKSRSEFAKNIVESDYVLCTRGGGNFSYRFFETLCCGRIPILIDTNCVLPYEEFIDWDRYCIRIQENEFSQLTERILEFHDSFSPNEFGELQAACRHLWERWLSPEGFFSNFYRHFKLSEEAPDKNVCV